MIRRLSIILLSLAALASLGYLLYRAQERKEQGSVAGVEVILEGKKGAKLFVNEEAVLQEIERLGFDLVGQSLDSVGLAQLQQELSKSPILKEVKVYRTARSGRIKIVIEQEEPLFVVQSAGESYYVTTEGKTISPDTQYPVYIPVVSGTLDKAFATSKLYDLISYINGDSYFKHYFGHYYVDSKQGIILTPRLGTARIILGHSDDWAMMLGKLRTFDKEVISRRGWNAFEYIKLPFGKQVVAKERA